MRRIDLARLDVHIEYDCRDFRPCRKQIVSKLQLRKILVSVPQIDLSSTWDLYCMGCNAWYGDTVRSGRCPKCGGGLARSDAATTDTVMLSEDLNQMAREHSKAGFDSDPLVGRQLHVYQCMSLIGSGAMGRVYLATHNDLQRHCALKILSPKRGSCGDEYVTRFMEEGRAAAALVHPNVVTVHAVGQVAGTHFLEMEFISGRSLQQLIRDEGPLPVNRALTLAMMVADGLAAAHRAGIVHRDVKPDNVLMTRDGRAKIGDFGLAKQILNSRGIPVQDGICGTPNYMAPELFQGQSATTASDVYALGVCLFQLLTGALPHRSVSLADLQWKVRSEPLPNVRAICPEVSLEVASCVAQMTEPTPSNRPQDAIAATQLLHAVLGHERDLESLLVEAFRNEPTVTWTHQGELYRLQRLLPSGRKQVVFLEPSDHDVDERLLLLYSTCCPAQPSFYEQALKDNSMMLHGSLALREVEGQLQFVVIDTYPRCTVDPEEIRRTVLEIAMQADRVEHHLTGQDHN